DMAKIEPFKGVLYNLGMIDDISKVVAPPYDVISEKMQEEYYSIHEKNVIRLILGKTQATDTASNNRYTRAREFLTDWLKEGVLVQDDKPAMYIYEQKYFFKEQLKTRLGFISLLKIEDPHKSRVLPHEYTFPKPKKDRFELLKATKTNMSPIYALFEDGDSGVIALLNKRISEDPFIDVEKEGVAHRIWRLVDTETIGRVADLMKKKQILIADGHHRYEVSLNYRDWMRKRRKSAEKEAPYDYLMVHFSSLNPEALTVLSTHRVIRSVKGLDIKKALEGLGEYFSVENSPSKDAMLSKIEGGSKGGFTYGMYHKEGGFFTLTLKDKKTLDDFIAEGKHYQWKCLDVTILHQLIFDRVLKVKENVAKRDNIVYTRETDHAVKLVDEENYEIAFFLNPPRIEQIKDVAHSHDRMPRKTTYFYPKPLSGLVFYQHENDIVGSRGKGQEVRGEKYN
ncbi:MAG: DUF1015 domain-containing protein, partial [Candidatus Omnitrophota bacterium]